MHKIQDTELEKIKTLIIEDDLSIAELERDYLEVANFSVKIQRDGATALEIIKNTTENNSYDLYIIDLMLPGNDGFAICRELRTRVERPILIVSARDSEIDKIRALGIGADDYITKPFSPAELVARAKVHIERYKRLKGNSKEKLIVAGDLSIDKERKYVSIAGKVLQLTATEYKILVLLASYPGKVFSREEIFDQIRGESVFGEINTVTVHIRRLREKIEKNPSTPNYVETVWGMGYRFNI